MATVVLVLLISFVASLTRSTLGFGESLIAVPLLLLFMPAEVAVPLSVMLSIIIALVIVIQDHSKVHIQSAKWLILYAIPGIPLGLLLLIYGHTLLVKTILGFLIIAYALYSLFGKLSLQCKSKSLLFVCGFLSGILGGAYGLNGPPLVIYGDMKKWSAKYFRATLQAYFLPASLLGFVGYAIKGLVTTEVTSYFLWSLLTVIPAIFLGRYLNHKLKSQAFFRYVYGGLIIVGAVLVLTTWV